MSSHLPLDVRRLLLPIRLLVLDVDGVLTDGQLLYAASGEQLKGFCVRDGLAIRLLLSCDVAVAVITGRTSDAVATRCRDLGISDDLVFQGSRDKAAHLDQIMQRLELSRPQIAAMGDDLPDLPLLSRVGFAACPADAAPEVIALCHYVCRSRGGHGAVRELAELVLKGKQRWSELVAPWTSSQPGADDPS